MAPGHLYFLVLLCNHTSVCIFEWLTRDPGTFNGELALASSTLIDAQSGMLDLHAHRGVVGWDAGSSCTLWCYLSLYTICFVFSFYLAVWAVAFLWPARRRSRSAWRIWLLQWQVCVPAEGIEVHGYGTPPCQPLELPAHRPINYPGIWVRKKRRSVSTKSNRVILYLFQLNRAFWSSIMLGLSEGVFVSERRATYFGSLWASLILAPFVMPKWVWHSMNE